MYAYKYAYKYIRNGEFAIYQFVPSLIDEFTVYCEEYTVYQTKNEQVKIIKVNQELAFAKEDVYKTKQDLLKCLEKECKSKIERLGEVL